MGITHSTDFPILNQYHAHQGGDDIFVTKLDTTQSGTSCLLYSTYLGGTGADYGYGIAVDGSGYAYVTGKTDSLNFPALNQFQTYQGGQFDAFVTKIDTTRSGASSLIYSTYLGGGSWDQCNGIGVDSIGNVYVTGFTRSSDFPTLNQYQTYQGGTDAIVAKISYVSTPVINIPTVTTAAISNITSTSADSGGNVTLDRGAAVTARGVCWSTSPNPRTSDNKTVDGTGTGSFTSHLTGLMENTTYYLRAYAANAAGTGYGNQVKFTTNAESLTVTLTEPQENAQVSGTVAIKATVTSNWAKAADASILSVEKVEFYVDNTKIAEDTGEPYETTWDTTTYADGSHTVKAAAYNVANQAFQDEITVHVGNTPPEIMLNRTRLNFGSVPQADTASLSLNSTYLTTGSQTLLINNSGGGTLNWAVNEDAQWLTCTPEGGTSPGAVTVSADPSGLSAGNYNTTITVSDADAVNSPQTVPVSLTVYGPGTTTIPFGYFETPIDNSTVMSSVPVTGWTLDDIDITSIKIYRAPIPGHETGGLIYIGNAVMVDGARPDVEQQFPDYPKNYQAGWGYMMLTNFLPNQGNGTFTLYAKATDKEGNEVTLGSKTITCDNANAVKPFGAIDTPDQGGTSSGSAYVNFGWALTPQPNTIPTDGSTIHVWVDGVSLGIPVYNQYRKDIATLFPGYNNSNGAIGYFYLDTTAYENGVHTIQWTATDNAGNTDGIGSRYFTILNVNAAALSTINVNSINHHPGKQPMHINNSILEQAQISYEPVVVKKGYDRDAFGQSLYPGNTGIITIELNEDERVEIVFSPVSDSTSTTHGYMMLGKQRLLLPVGSTLDSVTGIFSWQLGPGFFGLYRFVFVEKSNSGKVTKKFLNVVIHPKYSNIK